MTDLADKKCIPCEGGIPPLHGMQVFLYSSSILKIGAGEGN